MKAKTLLILAGLLLLSLACTLEDLNAAGAELHTTGLNAASPTATALLPTPAVLDEEPTAVPATHTVCTGVPEGTLRVRAEIGTNSAVVAILDEGAEVNVLNKVPDDYKGTWAEITDPAGWVNARYLCETENNR